MSSGPSRIYLRLLAGKTTPERYVAVVKRYVDMQLRAQARQRALFPRPIHRKAVMFQRTQAD